MALCALLATSSSGVGRWRVVVSLRCVVALEALVSCSSSSQLPLRKCSKRCVKVSLVTLFWPLSRCKSILGVRRKSFQALVLASSELASFRAWRESRSAFLYWPLQNFGTAWRTRQRSLNSAVTSRSSKKVACGIPWLEVVLAVVGRGAKYGGRVDCEFVGRVPGGHASSAAAAPLGTFACLPLLPLRWRKLVLTYSPRLVGCSSPSSKTGSTSSGASSLAVAKGLALSLKEGSSSTCAARGPVSKVACSCLSFLLSSCTRRCTSWKAE